MELTQEELKTVQELKENKNDLSSLLIEKSDNNDKITNIIDHYNSHNEILDDAQDILDNGDFITKLLLIVDVLDNVSTENNKPLPGTEKFWDLLKENKSLLLIVDDIERFKQKI